MIEDAAGNLLEADAEAYVNTVNTYGVMGKGIALQVRQAFPDVYDDYRRAAQAKLIEPGRMHVVPTGRVGSPKYIINFPTKRHWKGRAQIADIESGLVDLVRVLREKNVRSVAVPPLGCGNGGLRWSDVRPRIVRALGQLPDVRVLLYAPAGAPAAEAMPVATKPPKMTPGLAALLGLFHAYAVPGYDLTKLEVQKLAYFLQEAGQAMRLRFAKANYGPYAEQINPMLLRMESHFIRGYGDRSAGHRGIRTLPGATEAANAVLDVATRNRIARVADLIQGFETPYGMELLATVHWVAKENPAAADDPAALIGLVHQWSERKRGTFSAEHVALAWDQLRRHGWLKS